MKHLNSNKSKKNKKGFTLIELLAVIIILGVLLLIAVPSISKYIDNSRRNTYVNQAKQIVNAVSTSINALELPFSIGKGEGIIVPFKEVNLEKNSAKTRSPYSKFVDDKCFVLVVFDGNYYSYYVSALDDTGHGIPLINEKNLTTKSIVSIKDTNQLPSIGALKIKNATADTDNFYLTNINTNGNYIKVKAGFSPYNAGKVIKLKDSSMWYVISASSVDDDTVDVVSYYNMDINSSNYGKQNSSNPTIRFHRNQQNPVDYASADIKPVVDSIIAATNTGMVASGLDMSGAIVSMPTVTDFGCSTDWYSQNICTLKFSVGTNTFWTSDGSNKNSNDVYTISGKLRGTATTENTDIGIRIIIKNLSKSNIDKQATKALN